MSSKKKIVITGGGTGGHVFPALAIADELKRRNYSVYYVGSAKGMESALVPEKGYPFYTVKTGAVKNQGVLKLLSTLWSLCGGVIWSLGFLRREVPAAVVGVGGYVSVPISVAAFLLRIPLYLQEQNSSVGIANRFLGKLAKRIFLGFAEASSYFPKGKCLFTGNPLRPEFLQISKPAPTDSPFLLIMGGSQGSKAINDEIIRLLEKIHITFPKLSILHQTGERDFERVKEATKSLGADWYQPSAFIRSPIEAYQKASAVVCRSGALTVSELLQCRRPALLVPYPRRGQNDQITNANYVKNLGVGYVVEQGDGFSNRFETALFELLRPEILAKMAQTYGQLQLPNALANIGATIDTDLQS